MNRFIFKGGNSIKIALHPFWKGVSSIKNKNSTEDYVAFTKAVNREI